MNGRFVVLASGSRGNASLLQIDGFGLLIDCGLAPNVLTARLAEAGTSWEAVNAVILTHTHGDHWKSRTLADLRSRNVPLWAHPQHFDQLASMSPTFAPLRRAGLTRTYQPGRVQPLAPGLSVLPIPVSHDAEPTFAFRFDAHQAAAGVSTGPAWSVGYAADLGCWTAELADALANVDVLAVEYNHDVGLQRASSRKWHLVERVLSDTGHLSNEQGAALTAAVLARSGVRFPRYVIQLHLSQECNRVELARAAGSAALAVSRSPVELITASQDRASVSIHLA